MKVVIDLGKKSADYWADKRAALEDLDELLWEMRIRIKGALASNNPDVLIGEVKGRSGRVVGAGGKMVEEAGGKFKGASQAAALVASGALIDSLATGPGVSTAGLAAAIAILVAPTVVSSVRNRGNGVG